MKVPTDPNERRRTRQDIATFGNVLSPLLFFALCPIEIHRRSLRPSASPRSFTTRKKNLFLLLFGILSGRPFMARTSPFPSLGNFELPVLPSCKPKDSKVREKARSGRTDETRTTAGKENRQHTRTLHRQTSYR